MKRKSILVLLLLPVLILALSIGSFAAAPSPESGDGAHESSTAAEKDFSEMTDEEKAEIAVRREKATGFWALVNGYISLCEEGGVVTLALGQWSEAYVVENDVLYVKDTADPHPVMFPVTLALCAVLSYVVGSVNFGVVVSKKLCNDDVRKHGSGNAGMTNVMRVHGKKAAILTFVGDAGKAALCAWVALMMAGNAGGYLALTGCMIGHAFPVFFKFKGGKGVSCLAGGMLVLEPVVALILIAFFAVIVLGTKYVSLGSIIAGCLLPILVDGAWKISPFHTAGTHWYDKPVVMICAVVYAVGIVWLHRENIKRLLAGEERKTDLIRDLFRKKKEEKN
jgi:glycerol-3-phosphate acyltransferase PlsY